MKVQKQTYIVVVTIVLFVAAFFRLYRLNEVPPGLGFDESDVVVEAMHFGQYGVIPNYSHPAPPEVLARMVQGVLLFFMGSSIFTVRLASAFWGILTVALTYRAALELFRSKPYRYQSAWIAALVLAVMTTHMVNSRAVYRAVTFPAVMAAGIWLLARAWRINRRRDYLLAGLVWGVSVLTYFPGLLMPPILVGMLILQTAFDAKKVRERLPNLALMLVAMLVVCLIPVIQEISLSAPLYARITEAGVTGEQGNHPVSQGIQRYLNAIVGFYGTTSYINPKIQVADEPLLNTVPLVILGVIGILIAIWSFKEWYGALLLTLLVSMLLPVAFSDSPIHGLRISGEFVVAALLVGAGGGWIIDRVGQFGGRLGRFAGTILMVILVTASGIESFRAYFEYYDDPAQWDIANSQGFHWYFLLHHVELGNTLNQATEPTYVPLEQFNFPATRFVLSGRYRDIVSFSEIAASGERLDLPNGQAILPAAQFGATPVTAYVLLLPEEYTGDEDRIVLLPALDAETAAVLTERLSETGQVWETDRIGVIARQIALNDGYNPFADLRVPELNLLATYGDHLQLVGWDAPRTLPPGEEITLTLYWQSDRRFPTDVVVFTNLLDRFGNGLTGGTDLDINHWGYSPRIWKANQVVPDSRIIKVPEDLPAGPYGIMVGAYHPYEENLPVTGASGQDLGESYQLWTLRSAAPAVSVPDDLIPTDVLIDEQIALLGYRVIKDQEHITFADLHPGDSFELQLIWESRAEITESYHIFVHVSDEAGQIMTAYDGLPQEGAYPTSVWDAGEVIMTTHSLMLPPDADSDLMIWLGMYTWPDLVRLPLEQDGHLIDDSRARLWPED